MELVVGFFTAGVMVLAIGFFLSDHHRSYNEVYGKGLSDESQDEMVIRAIFNKTVRRASSAGSATVDPDGEWLELQYYSSPGVSTPDRMAFFYFSGETLYLVKGDLTTRKKISSEIVCSHVDDVQFDLTGTSAQMFIDLSDDNGTIRRINVSAAMRSP